MEYKRLIYHCASPEKIVTKLKVEYGVMAHVVRISHSPLTFGVEINYHERWILQEILETNDEESVHIDSLVDGTPIWTTKSDPDIPGASPLLSLFDDDATSFGEIDTGADLNDPDPSVPMFELSSLRIQSEQTKLLDQPTNEPPRLTEQPIKELRETFVTITSDYFMEGVRRELREALQEREAVAAICNAFPTLNCEFEVATRTTETEKELLRQHLQTMGKDLHEQQITVRERENFLIFEFLARAKLHQLVCQKRTGPALRIANSLTGIELPPDIYTAVTGFVARQAFRDAIELIKAHLEDA